MKRDRFELALERLRSSDWELFEQLCSDFLASEYSNLRTLASASGDKGRDAVLFSPQGDSGIVFQYSVAEDWKEKIGRTAKRVKHEFPNVVILVYLTNQLIGAKADDLRTEIRGKYHVHLDVRDRNWFLERLHSNRQREMAGDRLIVKIVDPYLSRVDNQSDKATALTSQEARLAFVYLHLQWQDEERAKGLTKVCFEALVRTVLRDTNSDKRMTREQVKAGVRAIMASHDPGQVNKFTELALRRLERKAIRYWRPSDEFCLSHEERLRLQDRLAVNESMSLALHSEIRERVATCSSNRKWMLGADQLDSLAARVYRILNSVLWVRGEAFVDAVKTGDVHAVDPGDLSNAIVLDFAGYPESNGMGAKAPPVIQEAINSLLVRPSEVSQRYMRSLADTYTLVAFLRETPDVQSVMAKVFSHGEVWLDTNVLLPVFAEDLVKEDLRFFSRMLNVAKEAGINLKIIPGVLEEIDRHMNRCLIYVRGIDRWEGEVPFLCEKFAAAGRDLSGFNHWIENFRGSARTEDDIASYLEELFEISVEGLEAGLSSVSLELKGAVQEIWHETHERRRGQRGFEIDPITTQRLVAHDVENFLGVVVRRSAERGTPFGYSSWWLTMDRIAFTVVEELRRRISGDVPVSPVLSPDFLVNYLALGPVRRRVAKSEEAMLPVALDLRVSEFVPEELLRVADRVRSEMEGRPERVIRRRIRDLLDAAKSRVGPIASSGLINAGDEE